MEFSKKQKQELRKQFEKELKNVPSGSRIQLNEELREIIQQILFDDWHGLKIPVWSGNFLSKLDLSEISFEDVAWGIFTEQTEDIFNCYEQIDEEEYNEFIYPTINQNKNYIVEYTNTNAPIDFKKSWEYKNLGIISIARTNFSGTDLSRNEIKKFNSWNADLSKTGIKLPKYSKDTPVSCFQTNLEGIDLSSYEIDMTDVLQLLSDICDCNLKNTGIKIIDNLEKDLNNETIAEFQINEFYEAVKNGSYDGCYINGKLINSNHSQFESLSKSISENIQEQIKKMKK